MKVKEKNTFSVHALREHSQHLEIHDIVPNNLGPLARTHDSLQRNVGGAWQGRDVTLIYHSSSNNNTTHVALCGVSGVVQWS